MENLTEDEKAIIKVALKREISYLSKNLRPDSDNKFWEDEIIQIVKIIDKLN